MHSAGRSWLLLTGFILFYIIYLLFGALVFSSVERPQEDQLRTEMKALKEEFLNQSCVNAASLEHFLVKVLTANKYGVSVLKNTSMPSNWDLASSMFFANTLVTTVGEFNPNSRREKWPGGAGRTETVNNNNMTYYSAQNSLTTQELCLFTAYKTAHRSNSCFHFMALILPRVMHVTDKFQVCSFQSEQNTNCHLRRP